MPKESSFEASIKRIEKKFDEAEKKCNDPLQGGHILAHFKVPARRQACLPTGRKVIKQPPDNYFDKTSSQIQGGCQGVFARLHSAATLLDRKKLLGVKS
ncbi:hypothetical protein J7J37_01675 [bacterium]|nr:hypothetical protein [bacterium]